MKFSRAWLVGAVFAVSLSGCAESVTTSAHSNAHGSRAPRELTEVSGATESPKATDSAPKPSTSTSMPEPEPPIATRADEIDHPEPKQCSRADGRELLQAKRNYRSVGAAPHAEIIIQSQNYAPIEAIQALYSDASGTPKFGDFGFEAPRVFTINPSKIMIVGSQKPTELELGSRLEVAGRAFADGATTELFQTLARVLTDVGSKCKSRGVRGRHLATRAYRDDIKLEFSFGPVVVSLYGAANGPHNPEHLYVLDLVEVEKSALWAEALGS